MKGPEDGQAGRSNQYGELVRRNGKRKFRRRGEDIFDCHLFELLPQCISGLSRRCHLIVCFFHDYFIFLLTPRPLPLLLITPYEPPARLFFFFFGRKMKDNSGNKKKKQEKGKGPT